MQVAIAKLLLKEKISEDGSPVELMSMEEYGSRFLAAFMEERDPPGKCLFYTIPEEALVKYAQQHSIPIVHEEKSDVRKMLERIAQRQPQTFLSLTRSSQRLREAAELLRKKEEK